MRLSKVMSACLAMMLLSGPSTAADTMMIDDFKTTPQSDWRFFADTVMGGVSTGQAQFSNETDSDFVRLTGQVSTSNNGGFIQIRTDLDTPPPADVTGIRIVARGNNQPYFVHLRTSGTVLPWQYYQASFTVSGSWTEFRLPLTDFERSGGMLRKTPLATALKSVGIVAYGRDHEAMVDVREIGFY